MRGVQQSHELQRIIALPRRDRTGVEDLIDPLSDYLRKPGHVCKPGCAGGFTRLNLLQTQALVELYDTGGLVLQGPLGCGKTGVSVLAPTLMQARRALLIIPGGGVDKTIHEINILKEHWNIIPFRIASYQKLAREEQEFFFFEPPGPYDLFLLDEAHHCRNDRTAVTRRIHRLREKAGQEITITNSVSQRSVRVQVPPRPRMGIMTATPVKDSISDVGHIMEWALDGHTPLPRVKSELDDWSAALDAHPPERIRPGALTVFSDGKDDLESVRRGVGRRIFDTPGCIASSESYVTAKLEIILRDVKLSKAEDEWFKILRGDPDDLENFPGWTTPDGVVFTEAADLWRHSCSMSLGYFTIWDPPAPAEWRRARYLWTAGVREILAESHTLDTVKQVATACDNGQFPHLKGYLDDWREIEPTFVPNSVPRWIGSTSLDYAARWLEGGGIVWTWHTHFGRELARRTGCPYFGEGGLTNDGQSIVHTKAKAIVASVIANGVMHNLQRYDRCLIASIWPAAYAVEQCIGRIHRQGQLAPKVSVEWMISCREQLAGFSKASDLQAPFMRDVFQIPARLCGGDVKSETLSTTGWAFRSQED